MHVIHDTFLAHRFMEITRGTYKNTIIKNRYKKDYKEIVETYDEFIYYYKYRLKVFEKDNEYF